MCKMAASKKKRVEEEMEDDVENEDDDDFDDEEDDESDDDSGPMDETVQMDFEARVPEDSDFGGMKTLLQQVFLKANINLSQMTDTIISQNYVGSVMKQPYVPEDDEEDEDEDDSVLALTTVINLTERKELECVQQLKDMLVSKCKQCGSKEKADSLNQLLQDGSKQVGYLINERFLNLPPNLSIPMLESLMKEMEKARKKKMKYDFSHYLMVCKTFEMKAAHNLRNLMYSNSEEELFVEASEFSFQYSVAHERDEGVEKWSSEDGMEPFRTVVVFPADKLQTVIDKIKAELAQT